MARQMEQSNLGYYVLPDDAKESYKRHVEMRAIMFCLLIYKVSQLCLKYGLPKPYENYLSDTAKIQVDVGVYVKDGGIKIDAAHLCNTSFLSDSFLTDVSGKGIVVSPELRLYCVDLRELSGATTPQTKSDNVGPDKVIDSFQTTFKNNYLHSFKLNPTSHSPGDLWNSYVTLLNLHLTNSASNSFTNPTASGYAGAISAVAMMASLLDGGIDWATQDEFRLSKVKIDELP